MNMDTIHRIDYKNYKKNTDFEIIKLEDFFKLRSKENLIKNYRLNFWVIIYITRGFGEHCVDFKKYNYKQGDIIFVQKNQVQRFCINNEVRGYILNINEPFFYRVDGFKGDIFLEFVDKAFGSPVLSFGNSKDSTDEVLVELIYKEYTKPEKDINIELIATLFQGFIISLRGEVLESGENLVSNDYENFKIFRNLVEENYKEIKSVDGYASIMHISKKTINKATRKVCDMSAKRYIIERLLLEIKRYLSQGELLNYEIAYILGFDEAANMTNFFKKYEGISPKEFKKMNNINYKNR